MAEEAFGLPVPRRPSCAFSYRGNIGHASAWKPAQLLSPRSTNHQNLRKTLKMMFEQFNVVKSKLCTLSQAYPFVRSWDISKKDPSRVNAKSYEQMKK